MYNTFNANAGDFQGAPYEGHVDYNPNGVRFSGYTTADGQFNPITAAQQNFTNPDGTTYTLNPQGSASGLTSRGSMNPAQVAALNKWNSTPGGVSQAQWQAASPNAPAWQYAAFSQLPAYQQAYQLDGDLARNGLPGNSAYANFPSVSQAQADAKAGIAIPGGFSNPFAPAAPPAVYGAVAQQQQSGYNTAVNTPQYSTSLQPPAPAQSDSAPPSQTMSPFYQPSPNSAPTQPTQAPQSNATPSQLPASPKSSAMLNMASGQPAVYGAVVSNPTQSSKTQ